MKWDKTLIAVVVVAVGFSIFREANQEDPRIVEREPVKPNWAAITAWPTLQADIVEAQPDPNRRVTAIVLDDSGSMGNDIEAA